MEQDLQHYLEYRARRAAGEASGRPQETAVAVKRLHAQRSHAGFTLIELISAMAIVGILTAIAIPSYSSYVRQGRRVDAKTAVLDIASLEERFYSTSNAYTNLAAALGYAAAGSTATVPASGTGQTVGSGYYQVTIPVLTAATTAAPATYAITATAVGDQLNDTSCRSFTVTSAGARTALNSAGADNTANCW